MRHELGGTGAVHQRVDTTPFVDHRLCRATAVGVLRHVALEREAVDVAGDTVGLRLVLRKHDRDLPAALGQLARGRLAHARGTSGNESCLLYTSPSPRDS